MCKSCNNCYWELCNNKKWCTYAKVKPNENNCNKHDYMCERCEMDIATLECNDKKLCFECLGHELELEAYTETTFHYEGVCLGTDEDIEKVYENLNKIGINVKEIED